MTFISKRAVDGVLRTRSTDINYTDLWHEHVKPIDEHELKQAERANVWRFARHENESSTAADGKAKGFGRIGHDPNCDCYRCENARGAYVNDPEQAQGLSDRLKRRHSHILAIALSTNPAKGSDVLKRFHRAKAHYAEMALKPELATQCQFLATTYEYAAAILWARMVRHARTRHETTYVRPRSDPGTIGRTAPDEPYVCEHPGCNCPAAERRTRGFKHCEVTGCNNVAMHGARCNEHGG